MLSLASRRRLAVLFAATLLGGLSGCAKDDSTTGPSPTIRAQGSLDINQTFLADLDRGVIISDSTADIWFQAETATRRYITPQNGATVAAVGTTAPGRSGCASASLTSTRIDLGSLTTGSHVCVRTNESRFSEVRITALPGPSPGVLRISFTTYD
jgi:hypothetical protein